jgi:cyclin A
MRKSTRADLVSLMGEFTRYFDLAPGTLHRAVSYVDRFLSQRTVRAEDELHLLGATAVYTAAKYEEQCTRFKVNATRIAELCGLDVTSKMVIDMESSMVATLQYDLSGPTAYNFVDHFTRYRRTATEEMTKTWRFSGWRISSPTARSKNTGCCSSCRPQWRRRRSSSPG